MQQKPVLELENLRVGFKTPDGTVSAVNNLGYSLLAGETLGIVGESGSGKSVSALAVMNLIPLPPGFIGEESRIRFMGDDVRAFSARKMRSLRGNDISMIFQDPMTSLNPYLRIERQMIEGMMHHLGASKKQARRKSLEMLEFVQMPDAERRLQSYPHELSGGLRQRVMVAMAMTCDPRLIFADEPTTALDVTVQAQILKLFRRLKDTFGTAIVLISHDLAVIATECDTVLVMYAGAVMEKGRAEDIFLNAKHPYTVGLKQSIPKLYPGAGETILKAIPGNPPIPINMPVGCPFADRCPEVVARCRQQEVPLKEVSKGHDVRCVH